jgi:hypothetical protein
LSVINFYFFLMFYSQNPLHHLPLHPYVPSNFGGRCTAPPIPPHSGRWFAALPHSGHLRAPLQQSGRRHGRAPAWEQAARGPGLASWGGRGRAPTRHRRRRHGRPQASFGRAAPERRRHGRPQASSAAQLTCCARCRRSPRLLRVPPPPASPAACSAGTLLFREGAEIPPDCADGRGREELPGVAIGENEQKKNKKRKKENLQKKNPTLSYVSSFDRFSVPRQPNNGAKCQKSC